MDFLIWWVCCCNHQKVMTGNGHRAKVHFFEITSKKRKHALDPYCGRRGIYFRFRPTWGTLLWASSFYSPSPSMRPGTFRIDCVSKIITSRTVCPRSLEPIYIVTYYTRWSRLLGHTVYKHGNY